MSYLTTNLLAFSKAVSCYYSLLFAQSSKPACLRALYSRSKIPNTTRFS